METQAPPTAEPAPDDGTAEVLRRIKRTSIAAWIAFSIYALFSGGFASFLALTCCATVTMISFLWLEEVVGNLLQPSPQLRAWRLTLRAVARLVLLGVALLVSIFVARFNASSVLLGFSIVVVGIIGEALYSVMKSFTSR